MDDFATGYLAGQDGGNNNGGFFGNEGLWAVIILAIIFGWGNYGNGRNGSDNGMASYIPYLVGTGATGQGGNDTRAALSEGFYQQDTSRSLAGIQSGICSLGYDQLAQINGINAAIAGGFAGHDHHQRPCGHYHRRRYDRIPSDRLQLRSGNC